MNKIINKIITEDLSGVNITAITRGNCKIMLYEELLKYNDIIDAIGSTGNLVLLFPTVKDVQNSGHWVSILYKKELNLLEHFDSYALTWRQERGYSSNEYVKEHLLGNLLNKAMASGVKVECNTVRLQKMANKINTCGRWCATRIRFSYLSNTEFARLFVNQQQTPDQIITMLTMLSITDDVKYEEEILKDTKK